MIRVLVIAALAASGFGTAFALTGPTAASPASCEQPVDEALLSNRIGGAKQSYRSDNPAEYRDVRAYLNGGARPSPLGMTHMGVHLVDLEDACRAPDVIALTGAIAGSPSSCQQSVDEALLANRIVGAKQSYRSDNPAEYRNVWAYLNGGARPSTVGMTHMGLHLVYLEDPCRAPDVTTGVPETTPVTDNTPVTDTEPSPPPASDRPVVPDVTTSVPETTTMTDTAPSHPPPSDRLPGEVPGQSYHLVFADDFQTFNKSVWDDRIWYDDPPPANAIYAQNSVLHLVSRRSQGYRDITVTTLPSHSFRRGYFEARMRWTKGNGAWPAFWLFSTKAAKGQASSTSLVSELDVFEGQGSEPNVFYGKLHRNTSGNYGVPDQWNDNSWQPVGVDLTADWHVYSALWTHTEVIWYLDGRELMRWPVYDSTDQDMFILFYMWIGGWTKGTDSTTPAELHTEVDWVRVWQKS